MKYYAFLLALSLGVKPVMSQPTVAAAPPGNTLTGSGEAQIAALKTLELTLKQGYEMARAGWSVVEAFSRQEDSLHGHYFASLLQVKPVVRLDPRVAGILQMQADIVQSCKDMDFLWNGSDTPDGWQSSYASQVLQQILKEVDRNATMLLEVTGYGNFQMSDRERLDEIENLYQRTVLEYGFVQHFNREFQLLQVAQDQDRKEWMLIGKLYGNGQ
ncbi:MAG: hypothetical protein KGM98_00890 [Bacteroidota bacterium]|nr:hypothetical protein [Bacteroidota bacterium]